LGRRLAPGEGEARAARYVAREQEAEILALLEGHWTATWGAGLLILGVIIGTVANIANT